MGARVLVVDDHRVNVKLLEARLQAAGFVVDTAFDGAEALRRAAQIRPDLILLDVMMPQMDGYEVCRRLRRESLTARVPVILVTALDKPSDREAGLGAGADEFLTKPVEDEVLFPAIARLLQPAARVALS